TIRMEGGRLAFAVADTGIGMTAEEQAHLFQPFTQTDASTTRRFGGMGLGLTITERLVEMLGGMIHVESAPGRGRTFTVTIDQGPLTGVPMAAAPTDIQPLPAAAAAVAPVRLDCRVLLAEDGLDTQRLISFYLRKAGASVVLAENGQEARERAWEAEAVGQPFAVGLTDMQMPVLAHQIKGAAGSYGFPAITEAVGRLEAMAKNGGRSEDTQACLRELASLCERASAIPPPPA